MNIQVMLSPYGLKMPKNPHQSFDLSKSLKERIIVIGDVHGCFDELQDLLEKTKYDSTTDELIFVGDLVCKGPKSYEVLHFMAQNQIRGVRGNVDENSLKHYHELKTKPEDDWGYYEWMKQMTQVEVDYLAELPYTITLPDLKMIVVHAGLMPNVEIKNQEPNNMIRMRSIEIDKNEQMCGTHKAIDQKKWLQYWKGPEKVIFGHDAMKRLQQSEYAYGLDTGCCYGNQLTALLLPSEDLIQVQAKQDYVFGSSTN